MCILYNIFDFFNNLLYIFTLLIRVRRKARPYDGNRHHQRVSVPYQHRGRKQKSQTVRSEKYCRQRLPVSFPVKRRYHVQKQQPPVQCRCEEKSHHGYLTVCVIRYDPFQKDAQSGKQALLHHFKPCRHGTVIRGEISKTALRSDPVHPGVGSVPQIPESQGIIQKSINVNCRV